MIKTTFYLTRNDGINLYKTESDEGFYIIQNETGNKYSSAIDVESANYTYSETDEKIEKEEALLDDDSLLRGQDTLSSTSNDA